MFPMNFINPPEPTRQRSPHQQEPSHHRVYPIIAGALSKNGAHRQKNGAHQQEPSHYRVYPIIAGALSKNGAHQQEPTSSKILLYGPAKDIVGSITCIFPEHYTFKAFILGILAFYFQGAWGLVSENKLTFGICNV